MTLGETIISVIYVCQCGKESVFDGNGGEFCPTCRTHNRLRRVERLARIEVVHDPGPKEEL